MILVDSRSGAEKAGNTTVDQLVSHIKRLGVPCQKDYLEFGDIAFEGNGPCGRVMIGIERKTLHDMLNCIDDSRLAAHQAPGMHSMYSKSFVMLEGAWKPHDPDGWLMEGFPGGWGLCRYRSRKTLYSKLFRYCLSMSMSGIIVIQSRDLVHTAVNVVNMYEYFQKRWEDHTSMIETQKICIPSLDTHPSLVRRWAANIEDVGAKLSLEAEKLFKTPISLANSDESTWAAIRGIGTKTAQSIIQQIRGSK